MTSCTATNLAGCPWHWLVVWRPRLLVACVIYFCGHWVFATRVQKNTLPRCIFENRTAGSAFQDSPLVDFSHKHSDCTLHDTRFANAFEPSRFHGSNVWGGKKAGGVAKQLNMVHMEEACHYEKITELCRESEKQSAPEMLLGHPENTQCCLPDLLEMG